MSDAIVNPTIVNPAAIEPVKVTMAAIRSAIPQAFKSDSLTLARSLVTATGEKFYPLSLALTGHALTRAFSGNDATIKGFQAYAEGLKGSTGARYRAAVSHLMGIKPAHLQGADITALSDFAEAQTVLILSILTPQKKEATTPKGLTCSEQLKALKASILSCTSMDELKAIKATLNA